MKRKVLSVALSIVLCMLSLYMFPVNTIQATETQSTDDESIILYDELFLGVGDKYEFELQFTVDHYYITTVNSSIVSVVVEDSVYKIVGESVGKAYILVNYYKSDGTLTSNACEVSVFEDYSTLNTEDYYLYLSTRNVVLSGNISSMVSSVQPWSTRLDTQALWTIALVGDNYYSIKLASHNAYLGVSSDNQIKLYTTLVNTPTYWRILVDHNGKTVIVPQNMEHTNLALGYNGSTAYLKNYYTDMSAQRWKICPKTLYIDNYYDSSALKDMSGSNYNLIRIRIPGANEFVKNVYKSISVSVEASGYPNYKSDMLADSCPRGNNLPCDNTCQSTHKDVNLISVDVNNNVPRGNNHIVVLWADRLSSVYTNNGSALNSEIIAHRLSVNDIGYPIINFFTITKRHSETITDTEKVEAIMGISLTHEVAHTFGMYEIYEEDSTHCENNKVYCIMNMLNMTNCETFYQAIEDGSSPFCDDCLAYLEESIPQTIYFGNGQ